MFEVGKLYATPEYYIFAYSIKEAAVAGIVTPAKAAATVAYACHSAEYWSEQLKCKIRYINPDDIFMCLKLDKKVMQILCGEIVGWIRIEHWLNIKRIG